MISWLYVWNSDPKSITSPSPGCSHTSSRWANRSCIPRHACSLVTNAARAAAWGNISLGLTLRRGAPAHPPPPPPPAPPPPPPARRAGLPASPAPPHPPRGSPLNRHSGEFLVQQRLPTVHLGPAPAPPAR